MCKTINSHLSIALLGQVKKVILLQAKVRLTGKRKTLLQVKVEVNYAVYKIPESSNYLPLDTAVPIM